MPVYTRLPRCSSRAKCSGTNTAPDNFDPVACPIIAKHWFGVEPLRPDGPIAAEVVADLRFRRKVQRVHRLGDRVFGDLLAEIGAERGIQTVIDQKLERYAELDSKGLEAAGGNEFWPAPLHGVER